MSYIGMESGFCDYSGWRVRGVRFDEVEFVATLYKEKDGEAFIWEPPLELIDRDFKHIEQAFLNFGKPSETSDLDYGRKYKAIKSIKEVVDRLVKTERERLSGKRSFLD